MDSSRSAEHEQRAENRHDPIHDVPLNASGKPDKRQLLDRTGGAPPT
jgi:hypothetical protein